MATRFFINALQRVVRGWSRQPSCSAGKIFIRSRRILFFVRTEGYTVSVLFSPVMCASLRPECRRTSVRRLRKSLHFPPRPPLLTPLSCPPNHSEHTPP